MAITELSLDSTRRLVQQSRAGDQSAFAALVEAYQSAVFGTVLRLVSDREVAAEVSNRAFFKAYEHLASYDESRPLRAWLLRIAANEALNELRVRRREATHTIGGSQAEFELERISGDPDPARSSRAASAVPPFLEHPPPRIGPSYGAMISLYRLTSTSSKHSAATTSRAAWTRSLLRSHTVAHSTSRRFDLADAAG